jgi:hypothetical protein
MEMYSCIRSANMHIRWLHPSRDIRSEYQLTFFRSTYVKITSNMYGTLKHKLNGTKLHILIIPTGTLVPTFSKIQFPRTESPRSFLEISRKRSQPFIYESKLRCSGTRAAYGPLLLASRNTLFCVLPGQLFSISPFPIIKHICLHERDHRLPKPVDLLISYDELNYRGTKQCSHISSRSCGRVHRERDRHPRNPHMQLRSCNQKGTP